MQRIIHLYFSLVFPLLMAFGCSREGTETSYPHTLLKETPRTFSTPEKLIKFVDSQENGFIKEKSINEFTYYVLLKPIEYLLAKERLKENKSSLLKEDFENLQYFDLRIQVNDFAHEFIKYDLSDPNQYRDRVNYCAFGMQNDVMLIDGDDTLSCVLFHFERAFEVVPFGHFTLAFDSKKSSSVNVKTIVFNDQLFNNGILKFTFSPQILVKEPTLL